MEVAIIFGLGSKTQEDMEVYQIKTAICISFMAVLIFTGLSDLPEQAAEEGPSSKIIYEGMNLSQIMLDESGFKKDREYLSPADSNSFSLPDLPAHVTFSTFSALTTERR